MLNIFILLTILALIPLIIIIINLFTSKNSISREKKSPFECGFDPISTRRMPIRTQFFLVGLVFLVFDVEITLLIPITLIVKTFRMPIIISRIFFLLILFGGIIFEYLEQSIE